MRLKIPTGSKYGNRKVVWNGQEFDSEAEYRRYRELKWLERAGEIRYLKRQVPYVLVPTQKDDHGKVVEKKITYVADFVYDEKDGRVVVEDVKGCKTEVYRIKKKLMLWVYGIRVKEIRA